MDRQAFLRDLAKKVAKKTMPEAHPIVKEAVGNTSLPWIATGNGMLAHLCWVYAFPFDEGILVVCGFNPNDSSNYPRVYGLFFLNKDGVVEEYG